jgi:hypothetical protein
MVHYRGNYMIVIMMIDLDGALWGHDTGGFLYFFILKIEVNCHYYWINNY